MKQFTVTALGETLSPEVEFVSVVFTVILTSLTPPAKKWNVGAPVVTPAQPPARLTVYVMPVPEAPELVAFRVWFAGAVTTTPPVRAPTVTAMVVDPVRAVVDLTAIVAEGPGPLAVLQVRDTVLGVAVRAAWSMPEPAVSAINTERI